MDLNEMKANWQQLSHRLQQQEIVNQRIIKEMIGKRTRSAHTRLIVSNILSFILVAVVLLAILLLGKQAGIRPEAVWIAVGTLPPVLAYIVASARFLNRFNLEKSTLCELRSWVLQLRKRQRMELWTGAVYGGAVFLTGMGLNRHYQSGYQLVVDGIILAFAAGAAYFSYQYIHKKSSDEIAEGLQELQELEQPEASPPPFVEEIGEQP